MDVDFRQFVTHLVDDDRVEVFPGRGKGLFHIYVKNDPYCWLTHYVGCVYIQGEGVIGWTAKGHETMTFNISDPSSIDKMQILVKTYTDVHVEEMESFKG